MIEESSSLFELLELDDELELLLEELLDDDELELSSSSELLELDDEPELLLEELLDDDVSPTFLPEEPLLHPEGVTIGVTSSLVIVTSAVAHVIHGTVKITVSLPSTSTSSIVGNVIVHHVTVVVITTDGKV